ncbi:MAG TPA: hypothetical protein VF057_02345 [Thermoanaerobaculia bacterium]
MRNRTPLRVVALGCAAFLAVFAIVWYSVLQLIAIRPDTGPIRPVLSGISAFFLSAALLGIWGFIRGHHRAMQPVNLGESAALPADGKPVLAIGEVRPMSTELRAPFSGTPCVFYMYRLRTPSGSAASYLGYRSVAFQIETKNGRFRVLAVPQLSGAPVPVHGERMSEVASQFVRRTTFEPAGASVLEQLAGPVAHLVRDTFTDEDGVVARDFALGPPGVVPSDLAADEIVLASGSTVCVSGVWDAAQRAITRGDGSSGIAAVSVTTGRTPRGETDMPTIGENIFGTLFFAAAGVGVLCFAIYLLGSP